MTQRTWSEYLDIARVIVKVLGRNRSVESLKPHDFALLRGHLAKGHDPTTPTGVIRRARVVLRAVEATNGSRIPRPARCAPPG